MKLKYIIGILVCLISLTSTALADDPVVLNVDNEGGAAVQMQYVVASVSGNVVTFSVSPKETSAGSGDYYPPGWFDTVGLPAGVVSVTSVTDKYNNPIPVASPTVSGYTVDYDGKIDGFKVDFVTVKLPNPGLYQEAYTTVHVTFTGTFNDPTPVYGAHVAWGEDIFGISSAKFMGTIPEFSSIAIPVAAIMGIMLISGRRRK